MSDLTKKDNLQSINTSNHLDKSSPVVFFSHIPEFPKDEGVKQIFEHMQKVTDIYRSNPSQTIRMQITREAFDRLKDRPGMKGDGYSHIQEVLSGDDEEFYLTVSPYTNVSWMKKLKDQSSKALTLGAEYYSTKTDDESINFELVEITTEGTSEIDDRSEVYPKDLISINFISASDADIFIKTPKLK